MTGACPRCAGAMASFSTSWFEPVEVCGACRDDERHAPNYPRARAEEEAAVRRGDYNFPGIGLAPADVAALAAARARRATAGTRTGGADGETQ